MLTPLRITTDWNFLDQGEEEERAAYAALGIYVFSECLTEGRDLRSESVRDTPYLSAYHLAEWLACNWWRLRYEPDRQGLNWQEAHNMASIGQGYVWPSISFVSDGKFIRITSKPRGTEKGSSFRYITDSDSMISAGDFEAGVDAFCNRVWQRLMSKGIEESNFSKVWAAVGEERRSKGLSALRRLEALLGVEPDALSSDQLSMIEKEAAFIGHDAVEELAAASSKPSITPLSELKKLANGAAEICFKDAIAPNKWSASQIALKPAWEHGVSLARKLRSAEQLGLSDISNGRLEEMLGGRSKLIVKRASDASEIDFSYILDDGEGHKRIVLRNASPPSRRFDVARLLGDHLMSGADRLNPATKSGTYRQKAQRAFAAELLSPISAIKEQLDGDFSAEKKEEVARRFKVSPLVIEHQLENNKVLQSGY